MTEEDVDGNKRERAEKPGPKDLTQPGVTVKHGVRDGIGDNLPEDWKTFLKDLGDECAEYVGEGKPRVAYERIEELKLDDDQRTYLESRMDSKTRAAIKTAKNIPL